MIKKIKINKAYSFKEAEEFDIKFWQQAGANARFYAAWSMVSDYLKIKGKSKNANKRRLRRTVQNVEFVEN